MKTIKLLTVLSCICLAISWALPLGVLAQQKPIKIGSSLAVTGPLAGRLKSFIGNGFKPFPTGLGDINGKNCENGMSGLSFRMWGPGPCE